jgi:uncharacterized protein
METKIIKFHHFFLLTTLILVIELTALLFLKDIAASGTYKLTVTGILRILESTCMLWFFYRLFHKKNTASAPILFLKKGIIKGCIWSIAVGAVAACGFILIYIAGQNPLKIIQTQMPGTRTGMLLLFLVGGIIGPVAEELYFRGILYVFFRQWGLVPGFLISISFFLLAHGIFYGLPVPQLIGGCLFTLAYEKEKNILVPIFIHCSGNLAIFAFAYLF